MSTPKLDGPPIFPFVVLAGNNVLDNCMHNNASLLILLFSYGFVCWFVCFVGWLIVPLIAFARLTESRAFFLLQLF